MDDQPQIRALCNSILKQHGFTPILAEDGEQGLDTYRAHHPAVSLVISDVLMPRKDGVQMTSEIFQLNPHANVILMTGFSPEVIVPEHIKRLCALLRKPFTSQQFIAAVRKCLDEDAKKQPVKRCG